jgi:sensor histidine kinase YesM
MKNRSDIAGEYLNTFAKLMRTSLQFSSLEFISIQDEVTFLHSYLNIEQLRFPDRFNYTIEVDENLYEEEVMMPPLIIQPFCENAIKHAFESDDPNNHISIVLKLNKNMKSIYCRIKDNGLGLPDKSEFINSHQSKGIDLIRKRIELLVSKYGFGTLNIEVDKGLLVELNLPIE